MTDYCTTAELGPEIGIYDPDDDSLLAVAISAASRRIDKFCGHRFDLVDPDTDTPATRELYVTDGTCLLLDQPGLAPGIGLATDEDLVVKVDDSLDLSFSVTLTTADYQLVRVVEANYGEIRPLRSSSTRFPCVDDQPYVQVTGHFGVLEIPDEVHKACLLQAARLYKAKDAVFGAASFGDGGAMYLKAALDPVAADLLRGLQLAPVG